LIKYFSVENFRSIKTENILEFDSNLEKNSGFVPNPVIGFAGANASGKTTILQALSFTLWFMKNSFLQLEENEKIPVEPFCTLKKSPTKFHLIFSKPTLVEGQHKAVDYEYELCLTEDKVLTETLYYSPYRKGSSRKVYFRNGNKVELGATISRFETKDLRANCSIVSYASQFASQKVAIACKHYGFYSNVHPTEGLQEDKYDDSLILKDMLQDEETRYKIQEFLKVADVGIEDVYVRDTIEEFLRDIEETMDEERKKSFNLQKRNEIKARLISNELELGGFVFKALFKHKIDNSLVEFSDDLESHGTLKFLTVLYRVLNALRDGTLLIFDEIELKLHQNLVAYLIGLFENELENKNGAQLIFSFHNTALMEILKPAQLWFAEKNDEGHTELFSAADFEDIKPLEKKNLETLYRIGRFGAKPRGI